MEKVDLLHKIKTELGIPPNKITSDQMKILEFIHGAMMGERINYTKDLVQIDTDKAIIQIVETALPRWSKDKVLMVHLQFSAEKFNEDRYYKELVFVFYRPANYTFVGVADSTEINEDTDIDMMSYHDSCWGSDGVNRAIRDAAREIEYNINDKEGFHVHNSFGLFGAKLIDGEIYVDREERKGHFKKIEENKDNNE